MLPSDLNRLPTIDYQPYTELFRQHRRVISKPAVKGEFMGSQADSVLRRERLLISNVCWCYELLLQPIHTYTLKADLESREYSAKRLGVLIAFNIGKKDAVSVSCLLSKKVSSDEMSVRAGQGSDEVLVSQAVWDYLAAAGKPWLLDFEDKQGLSAGIVRRGERGGCCAVRLSPVEGRTGLMEAPVSPATRKAFIDLCRCARKEMTKQDAAPKRKRSLLPCIGMVETDAEGTLLPPPPPQPRRSQRQQQRYRKSSEMDSCAVLPMLHEATAKTDCDSGAGRSSEDDSAICSICMGEMVEKMSLEKCGHSFCRSCLEQAFQVKKACPVCRLVYGQLIGNQPANGSMMVERDPDLELPGHEGYGCICIIYSFPPGFQSQEHPNPGVRYPGTDRVAYLPDSPEGNRVLRLLRQAFEQRLIFTIGTSMTTGMHNVITWNDIHHKTSIWGGPRCFGYPDPTYLVRVTEELREKGITD